MFLYVYKCLNGFGPNYLASSFSLYKQSHYNLRSAMDTSRLTIPKFKSKGLKSAFNRSFFPHHTYAMELTTIWTPFCCLLASFTKGLKTYLFPKWSGCFVSVCCFCFAFLLFWFSSRRRGLYEMAPYKCLVCIYVCMCTERSINGPEPGCVHPWYMICTENGN